jgi:alpha-methylacyl-CoA racemase
VERSGRTQPAPAPRFSRTSPELDRLPAHAGQHTREVLADWGIDAARIDDLVASGAIKQA